MKWTRAKQVQEIKKFMSTIFLVCDFIRKLLHSTVHVKETNHSTVQWWAKNDIVVHKTAKIAQHCPHKGNKSHHCPLAGQKCTALSKSKNCTELYSTAHMKANKS